MCMYICICLYVYVYVYIYIYKYVYYIYIYMYVHLHASKSGSVGGQAGDLKAGQELWEGPEVRRGCLCCRGLSDYQ